MNAGLPRGVKWACVECGVELETPARIVPKDGICSMCKTGWEGPVPCEMPEGRWCQFGWHHRIDAHGIKHVVGRCPKDIQRTADQKAAEYLESMKKKGAKKGFNDFNEQLQPEMYREAMRWSKSCEGRDTVALLGPPGTGKSHLMEAARWYVLKRGLKDGWVDRVSLTRVTKAIGAFSPAREDLIQYERWVESDALFIDDLGHESKPHEEAGKTLCALLDERGAKPLIFATNMKQPEVEQHYGPVGPALASRLFHGAVIPRVREGDYRRAS